MTKWYSWALLEQMPKDWIKLCIIANIEITTKSLKGQWFIGGPALKAGAL